MAVPEWLDPMGLGVATTTSRAMAAGQLSADPLAAADAPERAEMPSPEGRSASGEIPGRGAAATVRCRGLMEAGRSLVERCAGFFDPVVLAQLDAALAHEFAVQDSGRAVAAVEAVGQAVRDGNGTETLAHLSQQVTAAQAIARKSADQAVLAAKVVSALGGLVGDEGFDPNVVDQVSGAALVDVIEALEELKNAIAAAQAHAQSLFVAQQRLDQARAGIPQQNIGRGIAHQVALARHESPYRGRQITELSEVLVREMPRSMDAFSRGTLSEYRVGLLAKETAFLSLEHRAQVDQLICGDPEAAGL